MNLHGGLIQSREDALCSDEITIIKGAIDLKGKSVISSGTSLKKTFMLDINDVINRQTLEKVRQDNKSLIS